MPEEFFSKVGEKVQYTSLPPKMLHNRCLQFLLGQDDVPRETMPMHFFFCGGGGKRGVLWDLCN